MVKVTPDNGDIQKDGSLGSSVVLILRLSRLCGLTPLKFILIRPGRYSCKPVLIYKIYGWFIIPFFITLRTYKMYEHFGSSLAILASDMKSLVRVSEQILMIFFFTSVLTTMNNRMQQLKVFFDLLYKIEQKLGCYDRALQNNERRAMYMALMTLIVSLLVNTWDLYVFTISSGGSWSDGFQHYMPLSVMKMMMWVMQMQFIFLIRVILIRADALVLKLKSLTNHRCKSNMYDLIQTAIESHMLLRIAARVLNAAFDVPLMCFVVLLLFHLTITPAFIIKYCTRTHFPIHKGCLQITWLSLHILWIVLLMETAHQLHQKDAAISLHIIDVIRSLEENNCSVLWSDQELNRLLLRKRMIIRTSISMKAHGIAELSRNSLGTICGAISTYMMIFLQIEGDANIV